METFATAKCFLRVGRPCRAMLEPKQGGRGIPRPPCQPMFRPDRMPDVRDGRVLWVAAFAATRASATLCF